MAELWQIEDAQRARYLSASTMVRDQVVSRVSRLWGAAASLRDDDAARLVNLIVAQVNAGQVTVAKLTAAYLAQQAATLTGAGVAPALVDRFDVTNPRGVPSVDVYRRPVVAAYTELANGGTFTQAKKVGLDRLVQLAQTDLQLARTHQADASLRVHAPGKFFRRVLVGSENCALCTIASSQRYRVGTLSPIHPGCNCGVEQLPDDRDPGQMIDRAAYDRAHDLIEQKFGRSDNSAADAGLGKTVQYNRSGRKVTRAADWTELMVVQEHGEYGPTLTWRGEKFTGPDDV